MSDGLVYVAVMLAAIGLAVLVFMLVFALEAVPGGIETLAGLSGVAAVVWAAYWVKIARDHGWK